MEITRETLMQLAAGYRASRVLLTAVELDIFELIREGPRPPGWQRASAGRAA